LRVIIAGMLALAHRCKGGKADSSKEINKSISNLEHLFKKVRGEGKGRGIDKEGGDHFTGRSDILSMLCATGGERKIFLIGVDRSFLAFCTTVQQRKSHVLAEEEKL